ncbi:MAG: DUF1614 domain-containing protein [Methanomicrobiales archaeon]|nr:DUF1614 domain-containing protein [Methanomicrobiales archaeon]MDI6875642.1 DUF1614 domain-containing protein [Methanomicrobiales archaeon]
MPRIVSNPFTILMLFLLFIVLLLIFPLLLLGVIGAAFAKLGFTWFEVLLILFLTLIGSFINIPVSTVESEPPTIYQYYSPFFGRIYRIPAPSQTTTIAINVGGALIPLAISLYLVYSAAIAGGEHGLLILLAAGVAAITLLTRSIARPVRGLGIVTPFFIPPLGAALAGILLNGGFGVNAAVIAYVSGTFGTLIGADLLNLRRIRELGAPMVSIGGAGTFDGIFLTGVIAAFLA